jgi:Flp pilus assembly protein TadD
VALWSASVREAPWNARAWNNLGYAHELAGERELAISAYRNAVELDPSDYRPAFNLLGK